MRRAGVTFVVMLLLSIGAAIWLLVLGTTETTLSPRGADFTINCGTISSSGQPVDLGPDGYEVDGDVVHRRGEESGGVFSLAELVDGCGQARTATLWKAILVAIPSTIVFAVTGRAGLRFLIDGDGDDRRRRFTNADGSLRQFDQDGN